jgi:hypothetical protein
MRNDVRFFTKTASQRRRAMQSARNFAEFVIRITERVR